MTSNHFNKKQLEAIKHITGPLMILAGAGSGKTGVITHKIAYFIQNASIKSQNILAVTFTNKAANEMKERLYKIIEKKYLRGIIISTFHSLAVKILRKDANIIDFNTNFSIYSSGDQLSLIKQILTDLNISFDKLNPEIIKAQIGKAKNLLLLPKDLLKNNDLLGASESFCKIYSLYQQKLHSHQAMDFDDLLLYSILLLHGNPEIQAKYQKRFQAILVDEYQDTNFAQFELLKLLTHKQSNITIVGDDDQSIYSWRGAESNNFQRFENEFAPVKTVTLDQNYRSTGNILKAAGAIIQKNHNRKPKTLWSELGLGEKINYYDYGNEEEEAQEVIDSIFSQKFKRRARYHDFVILYRTNFQSRPFETALRARDIPYQIIGGISFYDRKEIKDLLAYLKLISNIEDDVSLLRIVNYPRRGIGDATLSHLRNYASDNKLSLFQAMQEVHLLESLDQKSKVRIMEFTDLITEFQTEFESLYLSKTFLKLIDFLDYESALFALCKDDKEWQMKLSNIKSLTSTMKYFENKSEDLDEDYSKPSLSNYLNSVSLFYEGADQEKKSEADKVTLLTLHSAKGLEFPYVYLVGFEEGIIPHENNENLEEERRLCYVGITRAMKSLTLTSCSTRKKYGSIEQRVPSQFLDDIPAELIHFKEMNLKEEISNEEAKDFFKDMKKFVE